nr:MAG TPA: hypothetical protein [Caudoviricetes sp.]
MDFLMVVLCHCNYRIISLEYNTKQIYQFITLKRYKLILNYLHITSLLLLCF